MNTSIGSDIVNTVASQVPGVVQHHIELQFRNTVRDFLLRSNSWREVIGVTTRANKKEYLLDPVDQNSQVNYVLSVYKGGLPLRPIGFSPVPDEAFFESESGTTNQYYVKETNTLGLQPTPRSDSDTPKNIQVLVSLLVRPGIVAVPDYLATHFFDGIVSGILYRLMNQPNKPYTSTTLAKANRTTYFSEVNRARDEADRFWTTGPSAWRFPGFASGQRQGREIT